VTKGLASRTKYLSEEEQSSKVWNVLEHIGGNQEGCHESFCYVKKAAMKNIPYCPLTDHPNEAINQTNANVTPKSGYWCT
jgi:hypothetical protein